MIRRRQKYPARIPKVLAPYLRREDEGDCPQHRAWLRQQPCLVSGSSCSGPCCAGRMHAHHVRSAADSGIGKKPPDDRCVPLCAAHHDELHRIGAQTFGRKYSIDLPEWAARYAARSPALRREAKHAEE